MSEQSLTGHTLGPYAIGRLIGQGGCASVYSARRMTDSADVPSGREVALKVFHPDLVSDERTFQRFEREADLGLRIRHRHIVPSYELGSAEHEDVTLHYMAMELVAGETLREVLSELGTVPEDLLYQIADQLLDALGAIHAEGMIHRDVKPENVILTRGDQQVRVMDLGVARLQQEGRDLTLDGEFIGSLAYASPEQFTDQDHVDQRTDIYAVGVLLYELATGVNPYDDGDLRSLIEKKLRQAVRRPRILNRDVDPFLDEVIQACLEKNPDNRFPTCEALRAVLAAREASPWWQARIEGEAFPAATRALRRLRPPRAAPLVGRTDELEALHTAYEAVKSGDGAVALVSGPAGSGKSRLVHDFLEELVAPDGPILLAGRCPEEASRAHHPFFEALRGYLGDDAALPEDDVPTSVLAFVRERAEERPVVFTLEDIQRADPETVALLETLARGVRELPVLLVVTWRPDALEAGAPLHGWTTRQAAQAGNRSITTEPLERAEIEALLTALVVDPRTARALAYPVARASGGNPHVLLEIVEHLRASGELVPQEGGWVPVRPIHEVALPESVRLLLLLRLVDVEADAMQLLEAAAAQGPEFDATLLADVSGQKRLRLLKRLAVLERKHRILESAGRGVFRFASHGLWQVIYEGMRAERRREVHGLCAAALHSGDAPPVGEVAFAWVGHLLAADRLATALEAVPAAAEHAATQLHAARGLGFLERLANALPGEAQALRFDVSMRLAALHTLSGHADEARRALEAAASVAQASGEAAANGKVANELAVSSLRVGDHSSARTHADRALALATEAGDEGGCARALHTLGRIAYREGAFEESAQHLRAALLLWQALGHKRGEATSALALGRVMPEIGERDGALAQREAALAGFRDAGDRRGEAAALNSVGNAHIDAGQMRAALACYEEALALLRDLGDLPAEAATRHNMARAFAIESRIEDARGSLERALDIYRQLGDTTGEAAVLDELGATLSAFGDHEAALTMLEQALRIAQRAGERATIARVHRHLANVSHEAGRTDAAWPSYERALELAPTSMRSATLADMGGAALREGNTERACALLHESLACAQSDPRRLVSLCRLARAYAEGGRATQAREHAETAARLIDASEGALAPHYAPEIYYSLATVLEDEDRGVDYLVKANAVVGARLRTIETLVYREHYLTTRWPNREILMEVRKLES